MKKFICDQTGQEIENCVVRAAIYCESGQRQTDIDQKRVEAIGDKEFCSLVALANYILAHCSDL